MKYKTVKIMPFEDEWKVYFINQPTDRVPTKTQPHPMGFYHYAKISDESAFNSLINCMLDAHEEEIVRLKKSIKALNKLKRKFNSEASK